MPAALPDSVSTTAGSPVTIDLLANDTGTTLAIISVSDPAHGTVEVSGGTTVTYTPSPGFVGQDSFTYTVQDGLGETAQGAVNVTVAAVNEAPDATADTAVTIAGNPVVIPVIANDVDPEGGPLRLVALSSPGHGTLQVLPDQSIRYIPQQGFTGVDYFTYTVADEGGATDTGFASINVLMPNLPPAANDDEVTANFNTPITIDMLANDNDPEGGEVTLTAITMPGHGGLVVNPNRTVTYTPQNDYVGPDAFTYRITDARGAVSTAEVRIDVRRINNDPVIGVDSVETPAGSPVEIDILANDNDPEGDPLTLSALSLPEHGTLALGLDQSLLYTPETSFVGQDSFTYEVRDQSTGRAAGEVHITVTPSASGPLFTNGYMHRRRLILPAQPDGGTDENVEGFVLLVSEQEDYLKSQSNGGLVLSDNGYDIRFEFEDGTKADHAIKAYDPAAGRLIAWVRVPNWLISQHLHLFLYYGNPTVVSSEANELDVWQDYLGVWDTHTGDDLTSNARNLTLEGVQVGSLLGECGLFTGSSTAKLTNADWLNGLSALTVQAIVDADPASVGTDKGIVSQGGITGSDEDQGFALRYDASGWFGGATNTVLWQIKTSAGDIRVEGAADLQRSGRMRLTGMWESGKPPQLFIDGHISQATNIPESRSGTTLTSPGALVLGAASKDSDTGGWVGLIDDVRFAARALTPARIAAEDASYGDPRGFYGMGSQDLPDDTSQSPVAVPVLAETTPGERIDIDVLANAVVPTTGNQPQIIKVDPAQNGQTTIVSGKIRYTPTAGFAGEDRFTWTLSDGVKSSIGIVTVNVQAQAEEPSLPKSVLRTVEVNDGSGLANALAGARPGDDIVLANGTYKGSFTLGKDGTADNPIVIRARNKLGARLESPLRLNGDHALAWGLEFDGVGATIAGNSVKVHRCRLQNTSGIALSINNGVGAEVGYCEFRNCRGRGISSRPRYGVKNFRIFRNWFHDFVDDASTPSHESIQVGQTGTDQLYQANAVVEYNLVENMVFGISGENEAISVKSSGNTIRYNTVINTKAFVTNRFGQNNKFHGNWTEDSHGIRVLDRGHELLGNKVVRSGGWGMHVMAGNTSPDQLEDPNGKDLHPYTENAVLTGNDSDRLVVGYAHTGHNLPATNTLIEAHIGPIDYRVHTGTRVVSQATRNVPEPVRLTREEVGPAS